MNRQAKEDMLAAEVGKAVNDANALAYTPKPATEDAIDPGAENISRARDLTAKAVREAYNECATRVVALARRNHERAVADKKELTEAILQLTTTLTKISDENLNGAAKDFKTAEQFAQTIQEHGEAMAQQVEQSFDRATNVAATIAQTRAQIEAASH
jgi:hypothetical protein